MMDIGTVSTPLAALAAGLVTGMHCCGMCGPLTCAVLRRDDGSGYWVPLGVYHGARLAAYALIGGLLGWVGQSAAGLFSNEISRAVPWAFALVFLVMGFGLERYIPQPRFFTMALARLRLGPAGGARMAGVLGLATPFLPCGPLYMVFGVAVFSGSFFAGAGLMAAFALGTLPIFGLAQSQVLRFQGRVSPAALRWVRQGFALLAAVLLVWRAAVGGGQELGQTHCPLCH